MASAWERLKARGRTDADGSSANDRDAAPGPAETAAEAPAPPTASQTRPMTAEELKAAFTRKRDDSPEQRRSEFQEQYSTESLFFTTGDDDVDFERLDDAAGDRPSGYYYDPDDPWAALGLPPDSPWDDVVAAHRQLAKANHPDTITGDADELARAEERIREINVAYALLRKRLGR